MGDRNIGFFKRMLIELFMAFFEPTEIYKKNYEAITAVLFNV